MIRGAISQESFEKIVDSDSAADGVIYAFSETEVERNNIFN
jgi:hypothetical protein